MLGGMEPALDFLQALRALLDQGVPTPFYAYDLRRIEASVQAFRKAFPRARLFYALKANPRLRLLARLRAHGLGVEAVSLGEVLRAYAAGYAPHEVLLNGPVKPPDLLAALAQRGVPILVADSPLDLERIARYLPGASVLLRLNPDLPVRTHPHLATGRGESQFGILPEEWPEALARGRALGLEVLGLHLHLGSNLDLEAYRALPGLLEPLRSRVGPLRVLDLGGGMGVGLDPQALAGLLEPLAQAFGAELWLEPGRALVAGAGVLVARIWGEKRTRRRYLLLDAGMTALLRPLLYGARHPVRPLYDAPSQALYDLAGPACEAGDVLLRDVLLPVPKEGDGLVFLGAGAYGEAMHLAYLDHPPPASYAWDGEAWEVWRRPGRLEDLWAHELGGA